MMFSYVVLYVSNMEKSVHFYRDIIGLECERRYVEDGVETAFMVQPGMRPMVDQPMIELVCGMPNMPTTQSGELLGFTVDSLERVTTLLNEEHYPLVKGPYSPDVTCTIYEYRGPDGERIGVMEMNEEVWKNEQSK
jgi:catechol 2,3-dioxygenase-like lactoylglutathione lyase family enzyme